MTDLPNGNPASIPWPTHFQRLLDAHHEEHAREREAYGKAVLALKDQVLDLAKVHAEAHAREHMLAQTAIDKAAEAQERHDQQNNEFRSQLTSQASTFATHEALQRVEKNLTDSIQRLEREWRERFDASQKETDRRTAAAADSTTRVERAAAEARQKLDEQWRERESAIYQSVNRIADTLSGCLTREAFQTVVNEWTAWRDLVNRTLATQAGRDKGLSTAWGVLLAVGGLVIAVAAFLAARLGG